MIIKLYQISSWMSITVLDEMATVRARRFREWDVRERKQMQSRKVREPWFRKWKVHPLQRRKSQ